MSNFLAVATVTAALSEMLQTAVGSDVSGATVTTNRPGGGGTPATSVNVYMYQVMSNPSLSNMDLPTRRANGELAQRPKAALDLHYLLTFFGDDGKLEPQRLLGSAVRALHARPILTRDLIRQTIAKTKYAFLATSNLADSVELVRFTPLSLSLEELSKLWSIYFQTPYSLSVAYQGTLVLIESEDSTHSALPVSSRNIYVATFRQPQVEAVVSTSGADVPIVFSSAIFITGQRLRGEITEVAFGDVVVTPLPQEISDTRIRVQLPAGLRAGAQGLQVVQPRLIGTPPAPHRGVESNLAAFVLCPLIRKKLDGTPDVSISTNNVTVQLTPNVGKNQRAVVFLNELNPPAGRAPRAFSFDAKPRNAQADPPDQAALVFPYAGVAAGDYLIRVQIDGADSPLEQDANVTNPVFVGPKVTFS